MQYLFLFPLFSGIINGAFGVYVLAISEKKSSGRAYCLFALAVSLWGLVDAVTWLPFIPDIVVLVLLRSTTIFWVPTMFLFLNLVHEMISKPRNMIYYFFLCFIIIACLVGTSTDWMLAGFVRKPWGVQPIVNPLYFPVLSIAVLLCGIYAFILAFKVMKQLDDIILKNQFRLAIIGYLGMMVLCMINGPMLFALGIDTFPFMLSTMTTFQSFFIYLAIVRYRIFSIDLKKAALEIFSQIQDGVILLDNRQKIVEANMPARELLSLSKEKIAPNLDIQQFQLGTYVFEENYVDREILIPKKEKLYRF